MRWFASDQNHKSTCSSIRTGVPREVHFSWRTLENVGGALCWEGAHLEQFLRVRSLRLHWPAWTSAGILRWSMEKADPGRFTCTVMVATNLGPKVPGHYSAHKWWSSSNMCMAELENLLGLLKMSSRSFSTPHLPCSLCPTARSISFTLLLAGTTPDLAPAPAHWKDFHTSAWSTWSTRQA